MPLSRITDYAFQDDCLIVSVGGRWSIKEGLEGLKKLEEGLRDVKIVQFRESDLKVWDSSLISFLAECRSFLAFEGIEVSFDAMSLGVQKLLNMSQSAAHAEDALQKDRSFFYRAGVMSLMVYGDMKAMVCFLGESVLSALRVAFGQGQMRMRDFWYIVQGVGIEALPIVCLIAFLTGFIMAFVGAVQLEKFGATIYVADLVGLAMVREMGAMMASVIMCGRTGAAFAATIGTMKVNEELDALTTSGISTMDFVVLPRILALALMMPLLTVFSDFIGILGGFFVGVGVMDLSFVEYFNQTNEAITLTDFWVGVVKGSVFGMLIALMGCLRGVQCGSDSGAVGVAATSAVVTGITSIIVADAIFAVLLDILQL